MEEAKSKGYTLKGALAFVASNYGEEGVEKVLAGMKEDFKKAYGDRIISSDWYPFQFQVSLYETIDRVFGGGDLSLCWKIGRFTAEYELSSIHRIFLKVGGPVRLFKMGGIFWNRYYNTGKLVMEKVLAGEASARVEDFNPISKAFCYDLAGWMERTLELMGARGVKLKHPLCRIDGSPHCLFQGTWES